MIPAIDPSKDREYTCKLDKENPTIWILRNLTLKQERYLAELVMKANQGKHRLQKMIEYTDQVLHIVLLGAKNFKRFDGTEAKFVRSDNGQKLIDNIKPWSDESLIQIDKEYRNEIAAYAMGGYKELEDDAEDKQRKNS